MPRWSRRNLNSFLLAFCLSQCLPPSVTAKVYECQDGAGDPVYTDDPQSFVNCRVLAIESEQAPRKPARPSEPSAPKEEPGKAPEQSPPVIQTVPSDPALSRQDSGSPPDPEYAPLPRVVQPQTQTCAKGINRLNPFGSAPCQPGPGSAPLSVPYEDYYR